MVACRFSTGSSRRRGEVRSQELPGQTQIAMLDRQRSGLDIRSVSMATLKEGGTFGDLATVSFYPAHHITMGEGGCVLTDQPALAKLVESFH